MGMTLLELTLEAAIKEAGEFKDVRLSKKDAEYMLALLKEQEAHVLTLEEVREHKPFHLWVEDLDTGAQVFPVAYVGSLYVDSAEDWSVDPDHRNTPEYYGKSWRCWTARPTDEQRGAVKWNGFD